jgi:hypothetical protein
MRDPLRKRRRRCALPPHSIRFARLENALLGEVQFEAGDGGSGEFVVRLAITNSDLD